MPYAEPNNGRQSQNKREIKTIDNLASHQNTNEGVKVTEKLDK